MAPGQRASHPEEAGVVQRRDSEVDVDHVAEGVNVHPAVAGQPPRQGGAPAMVNRDSCTNALPRGGTHEGPSAPLTALHSRRPSGVLEVQALLPGLAGRRERLRTGLKYH